MSQAKKQRPLKTIDWSHSEPIPRLYRPALERQEVAKRNTVGRILKTGHFGIACIGLILTFAIKWAMIGGDETSSVQRDGDLLVSASSPNLEDQLAVEREETEPAQVDSDPELKIEEVVKNEPVQPARAFEVAASLTKAPFDEPRTSPSSRFFDEKLRESSNQAKSAVDTTETKSLVGLEKTITSVTPVGIFSHEVSSGDTWLAIFDRYGFPASEARQVDKLLRSSRDVSHHLRPGQAIEFSRKEDGDLDRLSMDIDPVRTVRIAKVAEAGSKTPFSIDLLEKEVEEKEVVAGGRISSTLSEAAERNGLGYAMVDDFVDMFSNKIRFDKDLQSGDRFSVIFNKQYLEDGTEVGNGELVAAGVRVGSDVFRAFKIKDKGGEEHVVDHEGKILGNAFLRYPLRFSRISSHFSHSRLHPILKRRKPHRGVDFAAPRGTPVRSVADGKVTFAGRKGPNGIMIKISHGPRYGTAYLHLARISKGVRVGSGVKRGQVIGTVGSTGRSTGPHLDFRFYDNGKSVNPLKVKLPTIDYNKKLEFDREQLAERAKKLEQNLSLHSVKKIEEAQTRVVLKPQNQTRRIVADG